MNKKKFFSKKYCRKIIDTDINPNIDQWEAEGQFPAHKIFKKLGDAGLLGINKPVMIFFLFPT